MSQKITTIDELYEYLGYRRNYVQKDVKDIIDVDAFRQMRNYRPLHRSAYVTDTDTLLECEAQESIDQLLDVLKKRLETYLRESAKNCEYENATGFRLDVDYEDNVVELWYNVTREPEPETDTQVYSRLAHTLKRMATQEERKKRSKQVEDKKKFNQYKVFVETVSNMDVSEEQKDALIQQYKKDNGIE